MGGHSHWSQVKRQKGAADARRGQVFTKLGREISVAARQGGPDPNLNFRLRLALQRAKDSNMPNDTIERAIKRGSSGSEGAELAEATYEGYGPGGIAILVDVLTDNRNRSVSDIRATFSRHGGNLSEAGSVAWLFEGKGVILIDAPESEREELALAAIDAGAEDVNIEGERVESHTKPAPPGRPGAGYSGQAPADGRESRDATRPRWFGRPRDRPRAARDRLRPDRAVKRRPQGAGLRRLRRR